MRRGWIVIGAVFVTILAAPAHSQWAQFERSGTSKVSRTLVDELLVRIEAADQQAVQLEALFASHMQAHESCRARMAEWQREESAKLVKVQEDVSRGEVDPEALHKARIDQLKEASRWADRLAAIDAQFDLEVEARLHSAQMSQWAAFQNDLAWARLGKSYSVVPGMSARLSAIISELPLDDDQRSQIEPLMREYDEVVLPEVKAALAAIVHRARNHWKRADRLHRLTNGTAATLEEVERAERRRYRLDWNERRAELVPQVQLRNLNRDYQARATEVLTEDQARQLEQQVRQAGSPFIFDLTQVHRSIGQWRAQAGASPDLYAQVEQGFLEFTEQLEAIDAARFELQEGAFEALWNRPYDWDAQTKAKAESEKLNERRKSLIEATFKELSEKVKAVTTMPDSASDKEVQANP